MNYKAIQTIYILLALRVCDLSGQALSASKEGHYLSPFSINREGI